MALRLIDNVLPTTPDNLKKPKKVSIAVQKQSEFCANDENQVPLPQPAADTTIDYIYSENLEAIPDPESKIQSLIEGLDSNDWIKICESLNDARRLALYHSTLLLPFLERVMAVLVKAMKNPRSALIKTSVMASSDIFKAFGDKLLDPTITSDGFNNLVLQLLLKASQDKKFVCEEAERTLTALVESVTHLSLVDKLRAHAKHANPRIRAKAAVSLSNCISKMETEGMKEFGLVSVIQMAAGLLNDRLPEAREAARNIVISVHKAVIVTDNEEQKQDAWQSFCELNLPPTQNHFLVRNHMTASVNLVLTSRRTRSLVFQGYELQFDNM